MSHHEGTASDGGLDGWFPTAEHFGVMGVSTRARAIATGVGLLLAATCACTSKLSAAAASIRWVDAPGEVSGCQYLGIVEGSSSQSGPANVDAGETNARHEALERAAEQGATHVLWRPFTYGMYVRIAGEAYVCSGSDAEDLARGDSDRDAVEAPAVVSTGLEASCSDGDGASCYTLGMRFLSGDHVSQDVELGVRYLSNACAQRVVAACFAAAGVFDESEDATVKQRAARFYRAACKLGSSRGCENASHFDAKGDGDAADAGAATSSSAETQANEPPDEQPPATRDYFGIGTCFAVSSDGLVATADHVVAGASVVAVQFEGEDLLVAQVEKESSAVDVALLRVARTTKNHLSVMGDAEVSLGDKAFTIGFPQPETLGFDPKFSEGTVSALTGAGEDHIMQLSVPVHQGNSGGAVVSETGVLLGLVVARMNDKAFYESTGAIAGDISYAVKVSYVAPLVPKKYRAKKTQTLSRKKAIALVQHATCKVWTLTQQ